MSKILAVQDSLILLPGSISSEVESAVAVVEYWIWDVAKGIRKQDNQLNPTPEQYLDTLVKAITKYTKFVTIQEKSNLPIIPTYVNLQQSWSSVTPFLHNSNHFTKFMQSFWEKVSHTSKGGFFTVAQVTEPNPGQINVSRTVNFFPPLSWHSIFSYEHPNWESRSISSNFTFDNYKSYSKEILSKLKITTPPPWDALGVTIFDLNP